MFNTQHILQISSDDDGKTWKSDGLKTRDFRSADSTYALIAPEKLTQIKDGDHAGRIIAPVYTQKTGGIFAQSIYSDDGGKRWIRGGVILGNTNLHELTVIEIPGGTLLSFNRNPGNGGKVLWSASKDGAQTWTPAASAFGDSGTGVSSQVSAITLREPLVSLRTGETLPAIAIATPTERSRTNGKIHFAVVHNGSSNPELEWIGTTELTAPGKLFGYSSLEQLSNGRIGVLYEASPTANWADGLKSIYYKEVASTPDRKN